MKFQFESFEFLFVAENFYSILQYVAANTLGIKKDIIYFKEANIRNQRST